jgi:hypothetical protein
MVVSCVIPGEVDQEQGMERERTVEGGEKVEVERVHVLPTAHMAPIAPFHKESICIDTVCITTIMTGSLIFVASFLDIISPIIAAEPWRLRPIASDFGDLATAMVLGGLTVCRTTHL